MTLKDFYTRESSYGNELLIQGTELFRYTVAVTQQDFLDGIRWNTGERVR